MAAAAVAASEKFGGLLSVLMRMLHEHDGDAAYTALLLGCLSTCVAPIANARFCLLDDLKQLFDGVVVTFGHVASSHSGHTR